MYNKCQICDRKIQVSEGVLLNICDNCFSLQQESEYSQEYTVDWSEDD